MTDFIITYLASGWLVTCIGSVVLTIREGESYDPVDYLRIIPLWPILALWLLYSLIVLAIRWGLDD